MSGILQVAEVVAGNIQTGRYILVSVYALQVYDWLISLHDELNLIHRSRWSSVKIAFLCCRYYPLVSWPVFIWAFGTNHDRQLCLRAVVPLYLFMIPYQLTSQAVMVIRAWAFTGRQKTILYLLLAPAYAFLVAMELWVFATDIDYVQPGPVTEIIGRMGCIRGTGSGPLITAYKIGILFMSAFFVDFLCTFIIVLHCFRNRDLQVGLGKAFVGQGLGAFVIMTMVHISFGTISFSNSVRFGGGIVIPIPLVLSNIIACRLIISLRRIASPTETEADVELSRIVRNALTSNHSDHGSP